MASATASTVAISRNYRVTKPLFLSGAAKLVGASENSVITVDNVQERYFINPGLQNKNVSGATWRGTIEGITLDVISEGIGGRLIYPWRCDGGVIKGNVFKVREFSWSATSSGNDNAFYTGETIRKNIEIAHNKIYADNTKLTSALGAAPGSEGFGIQNFDGVEIHDNYVYGVGDDAIGVHFCENIAVYDNECYAVRGRIFLANCKNGEVYRNFNTRVSGLGGFIPAQCLMYIGFENLTGTYTGYAPTNLNVFENTLSSPEGSNDQACQMYVYGPRKVKVDNNIFENNSSVQDKPALYLTTAPFSTGDWTDPDSVGTDGVDNIGRVRECGIDSNRSVGLYPGSFTMTGPTDDFVGPVTVTRNTGSAFSFYGGNVYLADNTISGG